MAPGERDRHRQRAGGAPQREVGMKALRADLEAQVGGAQVGASAEPEAQHARARHAAPQCCEGIIVVDHRDAGRVEPCHHLAFGARHALEAAEALEVLRAGVGDHADLRARHGHQRADVAGAVGAHFDDGAVLGAAQPQQRQRHAQVIVQVAARRQAGATLREDRAQHFLGGGLAIAARHAQHRAAVGAAPGAARAGERAFNVAHQDLGQRHVDHAAYDRAGRAGGGGGGDELMAVGARAGQRQEQIPRAELTRIDHNLGEWCIGAREPAAAQSGKFRQRALHAALRAASAACTCSMSLKARRSLPTSW